MNIYSRFYAVYLALTAACIVSANEDVNEDLLPFHAVLIQDYQPEGALKPLKRGTRCVIIRPLNDGLLLLEFPRKGTYAVPCEMTDATSQIKNLVNVEGYVYVPRMSYFLANKIISGESGWQYPIRSERVNKFTRWIILYGHSGEFSTLACIRHADEYYRSLSAEERSRTALVYMDPLGSKSGIQAIAEDLKPSIQSMPGYLSRGYSKSLAHLDEAQEFPVLVETLSSGRVVKKLIGQEAIRGYLK